MTGIEAKEGPLAVHSINVLDMEKPRMIEIQAVVALRPAGAEVAHNESHDTKHHAFRMGLLSDHVKVLSVTSCSGPE